jgi:NDP-sugar pyrophosphorylase family protein
MKVAVLAGGFGTRLGDLTRDLPKPMLPVAGKPFLEHVIGSFARCGLRDFVILTGYRSESIVAHFGDGAHLGLSIEYSIEQEPLGTAGSLREARAMLGDRFLLTYGDVYRDHDYAGFAAAHRASCLAVYRYQSGLTTISCGNVALDDAGTHVALFRKGDPELELPYVDAGFALLEEGALDLLGGTGAASLEEQVYPPLAAKGMLEAEIVEGRFFDIGNPADMIRTRTAFEK